jgi:hypothetical protein
LVLGEALRANEPAQNHQLGLLLPYPHTAFAASIRRDNSFEEDLAKKEMVGIWAGAKEGKKSPNNSTILNAIE